MDRYDVQVRDPLSENWEPYETFTHQGPAIELTKKLREASPQKDWRVVKRVYTLTTIWQNGIDR